MRITLKRFLIFLTIMLVVGLMMQQCWQRKSDAEKWLYLFEDPARDYAGRVLGPDRGTGLPPPEPLKETIVEVDEEGGYVMYSSAMFSETGEPTLHMAFSPEGTPPIPEDRPDSIWVPVRDAWYQLRPAP
jgi:hypothetical protein